MSSKAKSETREIREHVGRLELRAAPEGSSSPGTVVGYAAVFEKYSVDLGYFREKIQRGAFAKSIGSCDVRALVNHDPNQLIGRSSAGTLRMVEDEIGLRVEIDLPDTTVGRDTAESIRRGDMQGQSFSFTTNIDQWDFSGEMPLRTLVEVDQLFDVGPVTFPAYEETSVAMRSLETNQKRRSTPTDHAIEAEQLEITLQLLDLA